MKRSCYPFAAVAFAAWILAVSCGPRDEAEVTRAAPPDTNRDPVYVLPGDRVIWELDARLLIGGVLPDSVTVERGAIVPADVDGRRLLEVREDAVLDVLLPEVLPERHSIELEFAPSDDEWPAWIEPLGKGSAPGAARLGAMRGSAIVAVDGDRTFVDADAPHAGLVHVRFSLDEATVTAYINETLLPALPEVRLPRGRVIRLTLRAGTRVAGIRIAEGGSPLGSE